MKKLERATALLLLVIKAHEKGIDVDIEVNKKEIIITHWNFIPKIVASIEVTDKRTFDKAIAYLTNVTK